MDRSETMWRAALGAMTNVLGLAPSDKVLVVTDGPTASCGEAFARGAREAGCDVVLHRLPDDPPETLPADLKERLEDRTVVINAIIGDADWIPFRIKWIQRIERMGTIRLGHSPGIDEDMLAGGSLDVDYEEMRDRAAALMAALDGAASLRITAPAGTDLTIDVAERPFISDVAATVETGSNLPCGEIYNAPVETGAIGVVVCDGCFGDHGLVSSPVWLHVEGGRVTAVSCSDRSLRAKVETLLDTDDGARTIAELGIGLNPGARLSDRMLEAEKALRTAHIAFGSNEGMPGGQSVSSMHIDYLVKAPTIEARWADGETRLVLREGKVVV